MARRSKSRTEVDLPGIGKVVMHFQGKMTAEDIRRFAPTASIAATLAGTIRKRITEDNRLASGAPVHREGEISGDLWESLQVRLSGSGRATVAFYGKSRQSGKVYDPDKPREQREDYISDDRRVANKLKGSSVNRANPEPLLEPSEEEVDAVLSALAQAFSDRAIRDAERPPRVRRRGHPGVLRELERAFRAF